MDSRLRKARETQAAVDTAEALKALVPKVDALGGIPAMVDELHVNQAAFQEQINRIEALLQKGSTLNPKGGR